MPGRCAGMSRVPAPPRARDSRECASVSGPPPNGKWASESEQPSRHSDSTSSYLRSSRLTLIHRLSHHGRRILVLLAANAPNGPLATALLHRQRTPAAAAALSNGCAPRLRLTSSDSRASRHSPLPNSTAQHSCSALHPVCHERCCHLTKNHHHDLGQRRRRLPVDHGRAGVCRTLVHANAHAHAHADAACDCNHGQGPECPHGWLRECVCGAQKASDDPRGRALAELAFAQVALVFARRIASSPTPPPQCALRNLQPQTRPPFTQEQY
jgi:hypothetical protein